VGAPSSWQDGQRHSHAAETRDGRDFGSNRTGCVESLTKKKKFFLNKEQSITYPLDVVRRRMQIIGMPETQFAGEEYARGTFRALVMIVKREVRRKKERKVVCAC
jgi:hypothetical protein